MATIFLSYARIDRTLVAPLKEALEKQGHDVWIDQSGLPEASAWREEIRQAIVRRDIFLIAVSQASVRSVECMKELKHALDLNKRIIPAVIDDVQPSAAPLDLADINWIPAAAHDRIQKAIDTDPVHLQRHTRFLIAAEEFERNKGGVLRGANLEEAEQWLADAGAKEPAPTEQHRRLIAASERARTRRRIWTAAGTVVFIAAIVTLSIVARKRAASERTTLANRLAGESLSLWDKNRFDESMLLAVAAYQAAPTSSAVRALLNAAQSEPELETVLHGHRSYAGAVAFDPRGGRLVSAGEDHVLHVFNTTTWKPIATIPAGTASISQLVFAPDGSFLLSAGWDSTIRRWDLAGRKELGPPLHVQRGIIEALALHPGKRFVAAAYSNGALLWDLAQTPPTATELPVSSSNRINGVAFSGDGTSLAVIDATNTISCWTFTDGVLSHRRDSGDLGAHITALASHGDEFIAGLTDGTIVWLSADQLVAGRRVTTPGKTIILSLALSSDGRWLAAGSREVAVWREDHTTPDIVFPSRDRVLALAFQSGTARLAASGIDPAIYVLDPTVRQRLAEVVHRVRASIHDIAFAPDGNSVIATTDNTQLRVQLPSREIAPIAYAPPGDDVTTVADGPDGTRVTATGKTGITVTRHGTKTDLHGIKFSTVMSILFSPRGDILVAGDNGGLVAAWDMKSLTFLRSWKAHDTVAWMAFSPDGKQLAAVDAGTGVITLIDPYGTAVTTFEGECDRVFSAEYVQDGTKLVAGCHDGSLELLDIATHERLGVIPDNEKRDDPDFVNAMARHPRDDVFATGTEDGRIMIWRLDPAYWLRAACRRANRDLDSSVAGWTGAPLLPCSQLLLNAPPDTRRPDVEQDEDAVPRIPLSIARKSRALEYGRFTAPQRGIRSNYLWSAGVSPAGWGRLGVRNPAPRRRHTVSLGFDDGVASVALTTGIHAAAWFTLTSGILGKEARYAHIHHHQQRTDDRAERST